MAADACFYCVVRNQKNQSDSGTYTKRAVTMYGGTPVCSEHAVSVYEILEHTILKIGESR